jgi:hypothetical protein
MNRAISPRARGCVEYELIDRAVDAFATDHRECQIHEGADAIRRSAKNLGQQVDQHLCPNGAIEGSFLCTIDAMGRGIGLLCDADPSEADRRLVH